MYGVMAIRFFDDVDFVFVVFLRATRVLNLRSRCFFCHGRAFAFDSRSRVLASSFVTYDFLPKQSRPAWSGIAKLGIVHNVRLCMRCLDPSRTMRMETLARALVGVHYRILLSRVRSSMFCVT